jgi:hypothetical protein
MSNQTFAGGVVTNAQTGNPRPAVSKSILSAAIFKDFYNQYLFD